MTSGLYHDVITNGNSQGKVEQKTTSQHDAIRREVCQTPVERQHKRAQKPDGDSGMTKPERSVSPDSVHRTTWIRVGCQIRFLHNIPRETGKPLASRVHGHKIPACVSGKHRWRLFTGLHFESNRPPTHPGPNKARKRVFRKISLPLTTSWGSRFGCLSPVSEPKMIILINWNESHSRRGARNSPADLSPFSTQLGS